MSIAKLPSTSDPVPSGAPELGEDFPIVCEKCLGPNPYCRMIKDKMSKECRISGAPFTAFRWQGALKRWKETIVCAAVAREKNLCQACLNDLEYGVPYHVRDHVMDALGEESAPKSDVSREFHWANKRQKLSDDPSDAGGFDTYDKLNNHVDRLRELAALAPGPVVWRERRDQPLTPEERERLRVRRQNELRPPADKSVTSLFVGGVPPAVDRKELLPYFLAYGEVRELVLNAQKLAAIVTFADRSAAERACASLHGNLTVRNSRLRVSWARRKGAPTGGATERDAPLHDHYGGGAAAASASSSASGSGVALSSGRVPPPPPGVRLPPGLKPKAGTSAGGAHAYPSMNPDAQGTCPEKN